MINPYFPYNKIEKYSHPSTQNHICPQCGRHLKEYFGSFSISAAVRYPYSPSYFNVMNPQSYPNYQQQSVPGVT